MMGSRVEFDPAPSVNDREIIPPSTKRQSLQFFAPATGVAYVSPEVMGAANQGIALVAGMQPVTLRVDIHGEVVQRAWHVIYSSTGTAISWIQGLS